MTSPQAFDGLRLAGRGVRRPDLTVATMDHNVPTTPLDGPIEDPISRRQIEVLAENCAEFGIRLFPMGDENQGIVHIIGPELGLTQPGMTIVCGDSHTSTHGAFGALAFGIGTSEVEHVLATQTLPQQRPRTMACNVDGELPPGVSAKDLVLAIIGTIGTGGGIGHVIEYRGAADPGTHHGRTDDRLQHVDRGRSASRHGRPGRRHFRVSGGPPATARTETEWEAALEDWRSLATDPDARFDREVSIDAAALTPFVSWGTNPAQVVPIGGVVPEPDQFEDAAARESAARALAYMGLTAGTAMRDIPVDTVFIGSCTNGRIEDLRAAAAVVAGPAGGAIGPGPGCPGFRPGEGPGRGRRPGPGLRVRRVRMAQPGMLDVPGHESRQARPGERSASTSNRNFEGRQGRGGRTHLVSPAVAAATAVAGHFAAPADLDNGGQLMDADSGGIRHRGPPGPLRRRHRSDHPERLAEASRTDRLRQGPVLRVA